MLAALAPSRSQLRAIGIALAAGVLAAIVASLLPGVESLEGDEAALRRDGLVMLAVLLVLAAGAAWATRRWCSISRPDPFVARRPRLAFVVPALVVIVAAPVAVAFLDDTGEPASGAAGAARLGDVGSNRYDYWEVAVGQFGDEPLRGGGPGSFEVEWKREREIEEAVGDAHSLPLETAAELGLVGLLLLGALVAAVAVGSRRTWSADPALAAGPTAALSTWALHACLDWDWEMPALTLVATVLAGSLLAAGELSSRRAD
jgi:O-antigen ligase